MSKEQDKTDYKTLALEYAKKYDTRLAAEKHGFAVVEQLVALVPQDMVFREGKLVSAKNGESIDEFTAKFMAEPRHEYLKYNKEELQRREEELAIPRLPDGKVDLKRLTPDQYQYLRKTDPGALGLK